MDISKYQHIKVNGYRDKWSAFDSYTTADGEEYIILKNDRCGDEAYYIVCRITSEFGLDLVCRTYDDIETALTNCEVI